MICTRCRFWNKQDRTEAGQCRRYPPLLKWPTTMPEDWCGDWQAIRAPQSLSGNDSKPRSSSEYLTIAQFCERFKISKPAYYNMRKRGEPLPIELRVGRKILIPYENILRWEAERQGGKS